MKKILFLIFFTVAINKLKAQCDVYTYYATCNDSMGRFVLACFNGIYTYRWSTGDTIPNISVKPGTYSVTVTDTVSGNTYSYTRSMWHDSWYLWIHDFNLPSLNLNAQLGACSTLIYTHPSCAPGFNHSASIIVWEDSIPIDTLRNIYCDALNTNWCCAKPGHRYDISIFDTVCHCFQATWMFSPPQTYYYPTTDISEPIGTFSSISIIPNPLTSSSTLQLNTQLKNAEVIIYDMLGKEWLRKKLTGNRMEIERGDLTSGVYFVRVVSEEKQWVEKVVVE